MIEIKKLTSTVSDIYSGGGNWLTQSAPTNFHEFYKRRTLLAGESVDNWREVTDAEKGTIEAQDAKWVRPEQAFIDRWKGISGLSYDERTGFFTVTVMMGGVDYGFKDITYSEAVKMLNSRPVGGDWSGACYDIPRINIFPHNYHNPYVSNVTGFCSYNQSISVCCCVSSGDAYVPHVALTGIGNCNKLETIIGRVNITANLTMESLPMLQNVLFRIQRANITLSLASSPLLTYGSMLFLVNESLGSSTVKVHPDLFAKLAGDTTNPAVAALTAEELAQWTALATVAAEKDITIVSA